MKSSDIMKAKVSAKGWVVIPAALRKRFCLKPGDTVEFQAKEDRITLIPEIADPVEALYGKLAGKTSLTEALLKDRAEELKHEEADLHIR
ncbi:MAG: AbrB/MazE/SpoVT family DNA-binding domain-containing protein [Deltaproteobacteria bacterium]|nr:AbrB/MazE/SpoVT family DNA-binding domain-containing protein [Deltaproteobacteria bacterium]MBW2651393.1 AbrB/MazE/SpoVT family DNA-binding domain-containing protein [Deltaproteobacteria bacterium]